jgi:hypothetical protein
VVVEQLQERVEVVQMRLRIGSRRYSCGLEEVWVVVLFLVPSNQDGLGQGVEGERRDWVDDRQIAASSKEHRWGHLEVVGAFLVGEEAHFQVLVVVPAQASRWDQSESDPYLGVAVHQVVEASMDGHIDRSVVDREEGLDDVDLVLRRREIFSLVVHARKELEEAWVHSVHIQVLQHVVADLERACHMLDAALALEVCCHVGLEDFSSVGRREVVPEAA